MIERKLGRNKDRKYDRPKERTKVIINFCSFSLSIIFSDFMK